MTAPDLSRRQLLGAVGVTVAGAGVLTACVQAKPAPEDEAAAVAGLGPGTRVAALQDVPVGEAVAVEVDGHAMLLTRPAEDEVHLFSAVCTHAGCQVGPASGELDCPCHGSRFALADGAVLGGPAQAPLAEVAVEVSGADVVLV